MRLDAMSQFTEIIVGSIFALVFIDFGIFSVLKRGNKDTDVFNLTTVDQGESQFHESTNSLNSSGVYCDAWIELCWFGSRK